MSQRKSGTLMTKAMRWTKDKITSRDLFGIPVSLTYDGEGEFKTGIGGFVSVIVTLILLAYSIQLFKVLVMRESATVTKNTVQTDLTYDPTRHELSQNGFDFGVALVHSDGTDIMNDPDYVSVTMSQLTWTGDTVGDGHAQSARSFDYQLCDPSSFQNLDQFALTTLKVYEQYYCPKERNLVVSGNLISTEYNYVKILIKKCTGSATCHSTADIDTALKKTELKLAISNAYFDLGDYSDPVKHFYDDEFRWRMVPGFKLSKFVQVQNNDASVRDSPVPFSPATSHKFFSVDKVIEKIELEGASGDDSEVIEVRFRLDTKHHTYERRVFAFSDMMGLIGGVFEVLMISGGFLVGSFSSKMYNASILNKLYQTEKLPQKEIPLNSRLDTPMDMRNKVSPDDRNIPNHSFSIKTDNFRTKNSIDFWPTKEKDVITKVKNMLLNRSPFIATTKDILYSVFC